jgi:pheromone a factor receptor
MHIELPIGAFVSATLVLVPLPWHWRARNIPTLSIIAWLFIANIIYGVNSLIWANNVRIVVPVWCDIGEEYSWLCIFVSNRPSTAVTKLQIGATMSLPACCLCLCIHLERIASVRQVGTSHREKRNRMIFDLLMCWGIPVVYMALRTVLFHASFLNLILQIDYVVQGHRFDIVEDFGCRPSIFNSIQSILLIWLPPLLVVMLTLIYAGEIIPINLLFLFLIVIASAGPSPFHATSSHLRTTPSRFEFCLNDVAVFPPYGYGSSSDVLGRPSH